MKTLTSIIFLLLTLLTTQNSFAFSATNSTDKSLGFIVGDPVGFSFKYWMDRGFLKGDDHAIDTAIGWKLINGVGVELKSDYVVHKYGLIPVEIGKAPVYYGLGLRLLAGDKSNVAVRIPVGINYLFEDEPFDAFLEIAPLLAVYPETDIDLSLAIGLRYRFR